MAGLHCKGYVIPAVRTRYKKGSHICLLSVGDAVIVAVVIFIILIRSNLGKIGYAVSRLNHRLSVEPPPAELPSIL